MSSAYLTNLRENLDEFRAKLRCTKEFLDILLYAKVLQPDEIEEIQRAEGRQNDVFIDCILEKLTQEEGSNDKTAKKLKSALRCTDQEKLLMFLTYHYGKLYKVPHVKHSEPGILVKYSSGKAYRMSKDVRGYCVIINNKFFDHLNHREGSAEDVKILYRVFTELGFQVEKRSNLTGKEIEDTVNQFVSKMSEPENSEYGVIALVLMSHGDRDGCIYGKDGKVKDHLKHCSIPCRTYHGVVDRYELYRKFYSCEALKGKPKIFVVQACAGKSEDMLDAVPPKPPAKPPAKPDVSWRGLKSLAAPEDTIIINSSFEGFASVRNDIIGSHFVIALSQVLANYSCEWHLEKMCKEVQDQMRYFNAMRTKLKKVDSEWQKFPVPCYYNFLQKKVYLLPGLKDIGDIPRGPVVCQEPLYDYFQPGYPTKFKSGSKVFKYDSNQVYNNKRGRCLIIINKRIPGSQEDADDLKFVFEELHFDVRVEKEDFKRSKILKVLDDELKHHSQNCDMFVMVLMSHGSKRARIDNEHGKAIDQHELRMKVYQCEALKDKPKVFITDAGGKNEHRFLQLEDRCAQSGSVEDALILDSNLDGGGQMYNNDRSLFIRILLVLLRNHSREWHLEKICKKIQDEMRKVQTLLKTDTLQIPCYANFLQKKLFLFPYPNSIAIEAGGSENITAPTVHEQPDDAPANKNTSTNAAIEADSSENITAPTEHEQPDDAPANEDISSKAAIEADSSENITASTVHEQPDDAPENEDSSANAAI